MRFALGPPKLTVELLFMILKELEPNRLKLLLKNVLMPSMDDKMPTKAKMPIAIIKAVMTVLRRLERTLRSASFILSLSVKTNAR